MAHDKVYGICENKCMVEVYPKSEVYSKSEVIPKNKIVHITKNGGSVWASITNDEVFNLVSIQLPEEFTLTNTLVLGVKAYVKRANNEYIWASNLSEKSNQLEVYCNIVGTGSLHVGVRAPKTAVNTTVTPTYHVVIMQMD